MNGMDINAWKEQLLTRLGKYRYVLLVILAGVVLLLLPPAGEKRETQPPAAVQSSVVDSFDTGAMERRLEEALSQVETGRVTVVLSSPGWAAPDLGQGQPDRGTCRGAQPGGEHCGPLPWVRY